MRWRSPSPTPTARLYVFRGDPVLQKTGGEPLFTAAEATAAGADPAKAILLGWAADGPRLAVQIAEDAPIDETRVTATGLRALAIEGVLSASILARWRRGAAC